MRRRNLKLSVLQPWFELQQWSDKTLTTDRAVGQKGTGGTILSTLLGSVTMEC